MALGGNVGDVAAAFAAAVAGLESALGPLRRSSLWRTEPVSPIPQPPYLNAVLVGRTARSPESLLALALATEQALGRRREADEKDAPRSIDIDLVFVGDERRSAPRLHLPHPRFAHRRFVLAPLAELLPDLRLPGQTGTVAELLARLPETPWVERVGDFPAARGAF